MVPSLDHVGIVSPDLGTIAAAYTALGFSLTPEQRQSGSVRPRELPTQWGSANRCAMLTEGYLELLGLVDPSLYDNQIGSLLACGPGAHILALDTPYAEAEIARLQVAGIGDLQVHPLRRPHRTPSVQGVASFKRVPLPTHTLHGGRVQFVEHESRSLLWDPGLLLHPNQACALTEVMLRVPDPVLVAAVYARLLGTEARPDQGVLEVPLSRGRLVIARPESVLDRLGGIVVPPGPDFVSFTIRTADRNVALRKILDAQGIPFISHGQDVIVEPAFAGGVAVVFAVK